MRSSLLAAAIGAALFAGQLYGQTGYWQRWQTVQVQARVPASHLGININDINADRAEAIGLGEPRGVEVHSVEQGSPAESAGIRAGDVLLTYNTEDILSVPQLGRLVGETPPDRKVRIQYWRRGKTLATIVTLTASQPRTAGLPQGTSVSSQTGDVRGWGVTDFPRMLMVWDNLTLGIECEPIDAQIAEYFGVRGGILVRIVEKGSVADKAGLRAGDVITRIDTHTLANPRDLISYMRSEAQPGKVVVVEFVREHRAHTANITLAE